MKKFLIREIESGKQSSQDPKNAGLPDLWIRITTLNSCWCNKTCPVCKSVFREGDCVRICPQCEQAYHDDGYYRLFCWQKHFTGGQVCRKPQLDLFTNIWNNGCAYQWSGAFPDEKRNRNISKHPVIQLDRITASFIQGLEKYWKPFGKARVFEFKNQYPHIRYFCPWCRYDIRNGDRVVKCPCGKCNTYFHDDIFRHLTCWNNWNGYKGNDFCPTSGEKIEKGQQVQPGDTDE